MPEVDIAGREFSKINLARPLTKRQYEAEKFLSSIQLIRSAVTFQEPVSAPLEVPPIASIPNNTIYCVLNGSPVHVYSCLKYEPNKRKKLHKSILVIKTRESYSEFLTPSAFTITPEVVLYNPYSLDDPDLKSGKSKKVIILPGEVTS